MSAGPLQPGDKRYVKAQGAAHGDEVLVLGKVEGACWACYYPDQSIKVVGLGTGRGALSANPAVTWVVMDDDTVASLDWTAVPSWIEQIRVDWQAGRLERESAWQPGAAALHSSVRSGLSPPSGVIRTLSSMLATRSTT